ncbi:uncharacterized protein Ecym_4208 [Eremothecium cymbalariae DBVPG|uniref:Uncharacterized protein n=1 Tax=Eremothecium cymbalariae (strain CBS 270.75 / DBVPG 7215 / KCTC 17166 / NRRL Y-17582) TaxID=931890 RepID=G8JTC2_ERECY|nr:hypothetical protein Ecym_4208 [Eremothecium cymbalariae DBVPG\
MTISLGTAIYYSIKPVLKIYAIIFVGFLAARFNILTVEVGRGISNLVVNVLIPCLLFNKIVTNISHKDIKDVGIVVLTSLLIYALGCCSALITQLLTPVPKRWFWGLLFAGTFANISDLPIGFVQSLANGHLFSEAEIDKGVAYSCIFSACQGFMLMNLGMFRMVGLDFKESKDEEKSTTTTTTATPPPSSQQHAGKQSSGTENTINISDEAPANDVVEFNHRREASHAENFSLMDVDLNSLADNEVEDDSYNSEKPSGTFYPPISLGASAERSLQSSATDPNDGFNPLHNNTSRIHSVISIDSHGYASNVSHGIDANIRRRRPSSNASSSKIRNSRKPAQTVRDVIGQYSAVDKIRTGELDLSRPLTLTEDVGTTNATFGGYGKEMEEDELEPPNIPGADQYVCPALHRTTTVRSTKKSNFRLFIDKCHLNWLVYILVNFIRPSSLGALLGIICSMIPWLRGIFVHNELSMHMAPDGEPVLSCFMDFTQYVGNSCIPLGLLLLGSILGRLQMKNIPKGFIRVVAMMTAFRLVVLPIIGILWTNALSSMKWLETDIGKLVIILTWSMPSSTSQIYFTAFYTPADGDHLQMDLLSVFFLSQYMCLFISLAFVVTFTLKMQLSL